jgi:hypothetical protein
MKRQRISAFKDIASDSIIRSLNEETDRKLSKTVDGCIVRDAIPEFLNINLTKPDENLVRINLGFLPWDPRAILFKHIRINTTWESLGTRLAEEAKRAYESWDDKTQKRYGYIRDLRRIGLTREPYGKQKIDTSMSGIISRVIMGTNSVDQIPDCLVKTTYYATKLDFGDGWEDLVAVDSDDALNTLRLNRKVYDSENPRLFRLFVCEEFERWYAFTSWNHIRVESHNIQELYR